LQECGAVDARSGNIIEPRSFSVLRTFSERNRGGRQRRRAGRCRALVWGYLFSGTVTAAGVDQRTITAAADV
jgi:hypothetical protein